MSFKLNPAQQLSIFDSFINLTPREQMALQNSWAKVFAEEVFPKIDEAPFAVLYSDKASRPNTPINVIVGACIIKELFDYSDDELVEGLMLDLRLQYALHTTSFEEQPLSDKTLSRFRRRCYEYEQKHGIDLYKEAIQNYNNEIAKMMKLDGKIRRMDSMMINSNMKKLARTELIYKCIAKLVTYISQESPELLTKELEHYTDSSDFNKTFYHDRSSTAETKLAQLLEDAIKLDELTKTGFEAVEEYQLFERCLQDQSIIENDKRRWITKDDKLGHSEMLLNPADPEATFRKKAGNSYQGYVANIEETVGKNGSIITDYEYEPNTYSDSTFLSDRIDELPAQKEKTSIIVDGAYYSQNVSDKATEKNIEILPTALAVKNRKDISGFVINDDKTKILECPAGNKPDSCCYKKSNDEFKLTFQRSKCENCPHKDNCRPKFFKNRTHVLLTKKNFLRQSLEKKMTAKEYDLYRRIRNGVETVPSILRRCFHLEKLPRGKQRGKFFFANKVAALNFRKLFNYIRGLSWYAENPLLT